MVRLSLLVAAGLSLQCTPKPGATVPPSPGPGAPKTTPTAPPATAPVAATQVRLPRTFLPSQYTARLAIDPELPTFDGAIQIAGQLRERTDTIWLHGYHLTIRKATARKDGTTTDVPLAITLRGTDVLEVRAPAQLEPGAWTLAIEYAGELDAMNTSGAFRQTIGEHSYVYTQLEAVYARRVFPCLDEPDNKVPWKLALDVPKALVAVANAPQASETALDSKTKRVEFALSKPLPTYLVAFGVGPFDIVDAGKTKRGTPVRIVTLANRAADAQWAAKSAARLVDITEEWFATPYPYEKLDVLTIPLTVGFGAMENAGLVTFSEFLSLHDPLKAAQGPKRSWIVVGAHEVAHQWFGNLVTPKFWDDIWLNEGFAKWLEYKIANKLEPAYREEESYIHTRNEALEADSLVTARQVRQPIATTDDIYNAFDRITYDKGASVLAMFETYLGAERFQKGVREYLAARAWGNATSNDFVAHIAATARAANVALDVEAAFSTFLDQPGAPEITATVSCKAGAVELALSQQRYVPPGSPPAPAGKPWIVPMCFAYEKAGKRAEQCTVLAAPSATVALETRACPRWLMPNASGRGYYRNAYTTAQLTSLRDEAWSKLTQSERMAVFFDVESGTTTGKVPLQLALSFVPRVLAMDDRHTVPPAVTFVVDKLGKLVPDDLRPKYEHYLRTTLGPIATKTGFVPRDGETLDTEVLRNQTVTNVAKGGRDPVLVEQALKLVATWRDLPQAARGPVLAIAADAKPAVFERLLRELGGEPVRSRRRDMIAALGSVRDVERQKQALALLLDPKRDARELLTLLGMGYTEENRETARAFFRANGDAILKRFPSAETSTPMARFSSVFTSACRADQRDAIATFVQQKFGAMPGGARLVRNNIEDMDQCIARRKVLEPEVRAWLAGLRLPKPKK